MHPNKILSLFAVILFATSCGKFDKDCIKEKECTFCEDTQFEDKGRVMGWIKDKLNDESEWEKDDDDWNDKGETEIDEDWDGYDIDQEHKDDGRCGNSMQQIIVEELVVDESCGCIVDGMIKYVESGKTIALVKYYDPECEGIGYKIHCVDGDCESKKAKCCKFEQECNQVMGELEIH